MNVLNAVLKTTYAVGQVGGLALILDGTSVTPSERKDDGKVAAVATACSSERRFDSFDRYEACKEAQKEFVYGGLLLITGLVGTVRYRRD